MLSDNSDVFVCSAIPPKLAKLNDVLEVHATVYMVNNGKTTIERSSSVSKLFYLWSKRLPLLIAALWMLITLCCSCLTCLTLSPWTRQFLGQLHECQLPYYMQSVGRSPSYIELIVHIHRTGYWWLWILYTQIPCSFLQDLSVASYHFCAPRTNQNTACILYDMS